VTALTRTGSKNSLPAGVVAAPVDYDDEATLVAALQGQQFLVITLPVTAGPDTRTSNPCSPFFLLLLFFLPPFPPLRLASG
jgi:uncharacterized protein YbjT (DUF2867 family)